MAQYISKDALVAELKFRKEQLEKYKNISETADACHDEITSILSFLDILEVKELDDEPECNPRPAVNNKEQKGDLIDKDAIKQKVQEKLLNACERHCEAERALCEPAAPQSWKDEAKAAWEEFVWRYQDYELVFKHDMDITNEDLNYDDYKTD